MPDRLYVSKHDVVEEWDPSKGTLDDAVASYVRMRQIARRRFSESGLDVNAGLGALDAEIDLIGTSKNGEPPTKETLEKTASAIDRYLKGNNVEVESGWWQWMKNAFS